jgi:Phosphotransferase enzyme family
VPSAEDTSRWSEPSWRVEAERWIRGRLADLGLDPMDTIEQRHVRPWGTALRVPTNGGTLWFKANIAPLAYEAPLLDLVGAGSSSVPRLVAADLSRGWMLMEDAGTKLTEIYGDDLPRAVWCELLRAYARLQVDAAPAAERLIAAGVPDRRLAMLVEGFRRVLGNERLVRPAAEAALTDDELERAHALLPTIARAVDDLAALELPDSLQHDDLHPWNVCLRDGMYCFIDWGDACISQPLLSFTVPLAHIAPADAEAARDACLEPWTRFRKRDHLVAAVGAARLLGHITGILKWELISSGLGDDERAGYEDAITRRVRSLLELACG